MSVNVIFARGKNGEFAMSDGSLPWRQGGVVSDDAKEDMRRFREMTIGNTVVMGFNTFTTMNRFLPERENIVVGRGKSTLFDALKDSCRKEIFVIGGAKLLHETFASGLVDGKIFETVFDCGFNGASVFYKDEIDTDEFELESEEKHGICIFRVFRRKNKNILEKVQKGLE